MSKLVVITDLANKATLINFDNVDQVIASSTVPTITRIMFNNSATRVIETNLTVAQINTLLASQDLVVQNAQVTLTNTQALNTFTNPQTILPAPGAGLRNVILAVSMIPSGASSSGTGANIDLRQQAGGVALFSISPSAIQTNAVMMISNTSGVSVANAATYLTSISNTVSFVGGTLKVNVVFITVPA